MMSRGISPYLFGPAVIGVNAFSGLVDKLWANVTSPYGPVFLWLAGVNATVVGHNELLAVVGFRVLAVAGVVMIAIFVPRLARSYGRDPSVAFILAVLNPLVLLHLVAGAHNDALMLGFLLAGLSVARDGRRGLGVLLCTIGAMVKVPAFIGVVYIGWEWLGDDVPLRTRIRPTLMASAMAVAAMAAVSEMVGLGWGWVTALNNPGTVLSWLDPPTAVGLSLTKLGELLGLGSHQDILLSGSRDVAAVIAAVISVRLLLRARGAGTMRAIGFTLLAGRLPRSDDAALVCRLVHGRARDHRRAPSQGPRDRAVLRVVVLRAAGRGEVGDRVRRGESVSDSGRLDRHRPRACHPPRDQGP